jgi:hypothetical protein
MDETAHSGSAKDPTGPERHGVATRLDWSLPPENRGGSRAAADWASSIPEPD